jgi:hypothetical protein
MLTPKPSLVSKEWNEINVLTVSLKGGFRIKASREIFFFLSV